MTSASIVNSTNTLGTDPALQFSNTSTILTTTSTFLQIHSEPSCSSPTSVPMPFPPHKPRLSRSPTPYSLMGFEASMDSQREKQQREHTVPDNSSNSNPILNSIHANNTNSSRYGSNLHTFNNRDLNNYTHLHNSNSVKEASQHTLSSSITSITTAATSDINDYKKPTAGWTLFAQLAKMTPEEVELIRLTKANTAANKQICARPPTIDPSSPRNATESMDSSILEISGPYRTTLPNSPLLRREISVSPPPPQLPSFCKTSAREQLPSLKEHDSIDNRLSSDSDLGSPSRLTNEQRLSPPGSHASPSSLSISPCQSSSSSHSSAHRSKRTKLDVSSMPSSALLPSGRFKSSSPVSPPKTVQIDESKNIVYSYQAGSTIIVSQSLSPSEQLYYDDEDDGGNDNDYEYIHKNDISSPIKNVSGFTTSSSSLSLPKWPWSAVASNISSSNQPETTNSTVKYDVASKSPSPNPSWTFEPSSSLDSVLNDSSNGTNTFMNIASSLDRLWSSPPSTLRRTYSEVTSSSSSRGNNSRTPSVSMLASSNINNRNIDNRLPRIPALRRQASMPSLENDPLEQDKHSQSKHLTWNPEHTLQTLGTTLSGPSVTVTCDSTESENEITMTDAESEHRTMVLDAATSTTTSTSSSGLTKGSRGAIRRRDTRQLHHPYRRPTVASTTASTSQNESFIIPPQIRRSASFSGTATTPIAQPVLRREASTTAYMDIL